MIHITFGSGIVLPCTQCHTGNYGSKGNFCFHAIISSGNWHWVGLRFILPTIEFEVGDEAVEAIQKLWDELFNYGIYDEMKSARAKTLMKHQDAYVTALKRRYIDGNFQVFLTDSHVAYMWICCTDVKCYLVLRYMGIS